METIYLTLSEFEQFLEKRYAIVGKSKPKSTYLYKIEVERLEKQGRKWLLLTSLVHKITIPDAGRIPVLKTLYGIPPGLIVTEPVDAKRLPAVKAAEMTGGDYLYLYMRRALLFAHVWGIKEFEMSQVKSGIEMLLQPGQLSFLRAWVEVLVEQNRFPESKPQKLNIEDTKFDFQFLALGMFLRDHFFPEEGKMDTEHRNWLYGVREAKTDSPPPLFAPIQHLIIGYMIALKASNEGKKNVSFVLQKIAKFSFETPEIKFATIFSALFFMGLFESKADLYFMAASAGTLFSDIESFAYRIAFEGAEGVVFSPDYKQISDAILNPIPNCVKYYQLKNPAISDKSWFEYGSPEEMSYPESVAVLRPNEIGCFLAAHQPVVRFDDLYKDRLCVTDNFYLHQELSRKKYPTVLRTKEGKIFSNINNFKCTLPIVATCAQLGRWIRRVFRQSIHTEELVVQTNQKHWILITENYKITHLHLFSLQQLFLSVKPDSITVFNFASAAEYRNYGVGTSDWTRREEQIPPKGKKRQHNLFEREAQATKRPEENDGNPALQARCEKEFPGTTCRVITKYTTDTPWEMVNLGIGSLQNMNLSDCALFDLRPENYDSRSYEYIIRCFRDVIVYDEKQRYLFMNL